MEVGGLHGLDQSIDYTIQMKVPRALLGSQGNNLVNNLASAATNKGIPVKLGETVNLNVKMLGSISNPSIKIDLKEVAGDAINDLKQQAQDFAQAKIDSAKQKAKDSLTVVKQQVKDEIKDKLKEQLFGKDTTKGANPDTTKKKPTETIKNTIKDIFNRKKKPAADSTKN